MFFQFNIKKILAASALILLPIALFNLESSLKIAAAPFLEVSYGVQASLNWVSQGIGDTANKYINLISIKRQNKKLLKELSLLKVENVDYKELQLENARLKKLLELKSASPMTLVTSHVISEDTLPENQTLSLDKGKKEGIQESMGVFGPNGVVGKIFKASFKRSQVLLLTDRFFVIEGFIQRSRKKVILEGSGESLLHASHLENGLDLQIGDLIVTSGQGGVFPKGLPIGVVQNVKTSNAGITKEAFIKPLTDTLNAEELFIIKETGSTQDGDFNTSNE